METFWGPDLERWFRESPRLVEFGAVVAQEVDPLVYELEREGPTTDGSVVRFHPAYAQAGRAVWASGILGAEPLEVCTHIIRRPSLLGNGRIQDGVVNQAVTITAALELTL